MSDSPIAQKFRSVYFTERCEYCSILNASEGSYFCPKANRAVRDVVPVNKDGVVQKYAYFAGEPKCSLSEKEKLFIDTFR